MGHAQKIAAQEDNNWDLEHAVRETKNFSTDLQLLMTETTNDPTILKSLVCLERQQRDLIPDEYQPHKKKLSSRLGLYRGQNCRPEEPSNNYYQPATQGPR